MLVISGPVVRNVLGSRLTGGRLWPAGARRTQITPDPRSSVARRRQSCGRAFGFRLSVARWCETFADHAWPVVVCGPVTRKVRACVRLSVVCGPRARDVRRLRLTRGRLWPAGARRTQVTPDLRSSVARRRQRYGRALGFRLSVARGRETFADHA
ncbi:hypothetical protein MLP_01820 [Microlunatus phosphovorus NM-1]|uniref:Uncharacterized protein n=1 Tax=Microlunatus phosphovorus (strain ATCC 700054 / DSM 10555 / JCM 9379 / NBRC 101784 / NCIMB 13414 / VKM Ac-1990 / NM-1) TaxID=1032480 RepID=F5XHQ1_MICPN|nr:hypothetical protein MLP_01820 [Microlunatus phosphovorus NM-1]